MYMSITHTIGQAVALLGSVCFAGALLYWINGMFLAPSTTGVYSALVWGSVGIACYLLAAGMIDTEAI